MSKRKLSRQQAWRISKIQEERAQRASRRDAEAQASLTGADLGPEQPGVVTAHFGTQVAVEGGGGISQRCHMRANLEGLVTGDRVIWREGEETGVVVARLDRDNELARPDPYGAIKPVAANIDQILIVIAPVPEPHANLIDRYLVAAESAAIEPVILLNKTDLLALKTPDEPDSDSSGPTTADDAAGLPVARGKPPSGGGAEDSDSAAAESRDSEVSADSRPYGETMPVGNNRVEARAALDDLLAVYATIGYRVLRASSRLEHGLDALHDALRDRTSVFVGQSGVGKSSLINTLLPGVDLRVGALSENTGKGAHTTTTAQLFHLPGGGDLIDSPGIREFGLWHMERAAIDAGFIEFRPYLGHCKFRDCRHEQEPGCAILAAVAEGAISERRFASYRHLVADAEA
jgi:ribosome biogenesis GTPase